MANFTVRIELHDAQWNDYEQLHAAMAQKGFSRQITSDDGKNLPDALGGVQRLRKPYERAGPRYRQGRGRYNP